MTHTTSLYFVFLVLPVIFVAIWSYAIFYNRRVKTRIREMEASGRHMHSEEEGIALVVLERERHHKTRDAA